MDTAISFFITKFFLKDGKASAYTAKSLVPGDKKKLPDFTATAQKNRGTEALQTQCCIELLAQIL